MSFAADPPFSGRMRKGASTTIKSSRSAATPDALLALVRLLARQAAREFVLDTPAQLTPKQPSIAGSQMTDAPARLTGVSLRTARRWIAKRILVSGKLGGAQLVAKISPAPNLI